MRLSTSISEMTLGAVIGAGALNRVTAVRFYEDLTKYIFKLSLSPYLFFCDNYHVSRTFFAEYMMKQRRRFDRYITAMLPHLEVLVVSNNITENLKQTKHQLQHSELSNSKGSSGPN